MTKLLVGLALVGGVLASGVAAAEIVTFDDISAPSGLYFSTLSDGGLTFNSDGYFAAIWPNGPDELPLEGNGTNNLIYAGTAGALKITASGGGTFNLSQVDLTLSFCAGQDAPYCGPPTPPVGPLTDKVKVTWTGNPTGETLTLGQGFQTYLLDITGVKEVDISPLENQTAYWALDNLYVSGLVPEPTTWAMMIGGLFGVGAVLRRRRGQPVLSA